MLRLSLVCVVALAAVSYGYTLRSGGPDSPDINTIKHGIIKREALVAAEALRKVVIKTPQCKVQIASIATDFITAIYYGIYSLDNIIANIGEDAHQEIGEVIIKLSSFADDLQKCLSGDAEALKQKLISVLEELNSSITQHEKESKHPEYTQYAYDQLQRKHDYIIYGVYKVKYQALFFDKANKDLEAEIKASYAKVSEAFDKLKGKEENVVYELRHALQHLSTITERCVYKLENWIEANPTRLDDIKIVEDVTTTLSDLYEKENRAIRKDRTSYRMKSDLLDIYGSGHKLGIKIALIQYPDNTGGQEFIRSCIFDSVTIGNAYADNFGSVIV